MEFLVLGLLASEWPALMVVAPIDYIMAAAIGVVTGNRIWNVSGLSPLENVLQGRKILILVFVQLVPPWLVAASETGQVWVPSI